MTPMEKALALVDQGLLRVDSNTGLVHQTFVTSLYTYERPVGFLMKNGYVGISVGAGATIYAHRLIWIVSTGQVPPDGMVVNHLNAVKTDNRLSNLEVISSAQNIHHAKNLGLIPRGDTHSSTKVSTDEIPDVLASAAGGESTASIAKRYDVTPGCINHILRGRRAA